MQYVKSLDGLRGLAVLLVILFHTMWIECGWIGVQLFFVLSGYLITQILLEDKDKTLPLGLYLKRFYWRRTLRIFPLYFAYLVSLIFLFMVTGQPLFFKDQWPYLFTYTYNFTRFTSHWVFSPFYTHFWSLAVEEQFYVVWPLLVYMLSRRSLQRLILVLLVAGPLFRLAIGCVGKTLGMTSCDAAMSASWFSLSQSDAFAAGAAVALGTWHKWLERFPRIPILVLITVAVLGITNFIALRLTGVKVSITTMGYPASTTCFFQHVWGYTVLNLGAAACVVWFVTRKNTSRFWTYSWLVNIGKVSYGIYILHWPVLFFVKRIVGFKSRTVQAFCVFPFYLIVVILLANLSYRYYESRFLRLKDRKFAIEPAVGEGSACNNGLGLGAAGQ